MQQIRHKKTAWVCFTTHRRIVVKSEMRNACNASCGNKRLCIYVKGQQLQAEEADCVQILDLAGHVNDCFDHPTDRLYSYTANTYMQSRSRQSMGVGERENHDCICSRSGDWSLTVPLLALMTADATVTAAADDAADIPMPTASPRLQCDACGDYPSQFSTELNQCAPPFCADRRSVTATTTTTLMHKIWPHPTSAVYVDVLPRANIRDDTVVTFCFADSSNSVACHLRQLLPCKCF